MESINPYLSLRKSARTAGLLYFVFAMIGIYGYAYLQPTLTGSGGPSGTAASMLAHASLFHLGKGLAVLSAFLFILIVWQLHRLFEPINAYLAKLMVWLVLVCIPVSLTVEALEITAFNMFKKSPDAFSTEQSQAIAMLLIKIGQNATQLLTVFWGLWLFPLGLLVYRSGFMPRILGVLLIINGIGYVIQCLTFVLFPEQLKLVLQFIFPTYFAGEIPFIFWLLIKGVRGKHT